ncbi:hypothetical protein RclHR1_11850001 [Rhizophagus clarus]|uniref:Uncharacterized protein n=1 Tax=Rhizophagus clarus TaxID=94130 RepID=A0A2Z6QYC6_9GLOM|nr:hypothetical protein RclHR1_11850001 [Rhizophagus clarus]
MKQYIMMFSDFDTDPIERHTVHSSSFKSKRLCSNHLVLEKIRITIMTCYFFFYNSRDQAGIINPLQSTISNSFNKKLKSPRGFIPEGGLEIVYVEA